MKSKINKIPSYYDGPISITYIKTVLTALNSWLQQRNRCNNKKSKPYKFYGAKGISVEYSSRDFINWWLMESFSKKMHGKQIVCDRIDSKKNYCFGNIQLITLKDNALKSAVSKSVINTVTGELYSSIKEAAEKNKVSSANVSWHCRGLSRTKLFEFNVDNK